MESFIQRNSLSQILFLQSAPPELIFDIFRRECADRRLKCEDSAAQQLAVQWFVQQPVAVQFPPRGSALRTFLKRYISYIEESRMNDVMRGVDHTEDPVHVDLLNAYIQVSVWWDASETDLCYKSFPNLSLLYRQRKEPQEVTGGESFAAVQEGHVCESGSYEVAVAQSDFSTVSVAVGQYANVGLAVWPAAFVLAQLLAQELEGISHLLEPFLFSHCPRAGNHHGNASRKEEDKLHIVELGAGVGLIPVLLRGLAGYHKYVSTYTLTDYQPQLIDNMRRNLEEINHIPLVMDFCAAARGLEGDGKRPFHHLSLLDWTHTVGNEAKLLNWGGDVILAADCIYDETVIPGLSSVLESALRFPFDSTGYDYDKARSRSAGRHHRRRTCIIVQAHRQASTMKKFFDRVRLFAHVKSFSVTHVRRSSVSTLDRTTAVPLGEWGSMFAALDPDPLVPILMADTVCEDGSLKSQGGLLPSGDLCSLPSGSFSLHSSFAPSVAKLEKWMMGPFFVSETGVVGVHILQLKQQKPLR